MSAVLEFESDLSTQIELRIDGGTCSCPVNGKQDSYSLSVAYVPAGRLLELSWLSSWVAGMRDASITHEALTAELADTLINLIAPTWLRVETTWAPVEGVECIVRVVAGE